MLQHIFLLVFILFFSLPYTSRANENHLAVDTLRVLQKVDLPSSHLQLLQSGDIVSIANNGHALAEASYFSTTAATRPVLLKHIQYLLQSTNANKALIDFATNRLPRHPYLKKANFDINVIASDGKKYKISYSSNIESNIYIIYYRYIENL